MKTKIILIIAACAAGFGLFAAGTAGLIFVVRSSLIPASAPATAAPVIQTAPAGGYVTGSSQQTSASPSATRTATSSAEPSSAAAAPAPVVAQQAEAAPAADQTAPVAAAPSSGASGSPMFPSYLQPQQQQSPLLLGSSGGAGGQPASSQSDSVAMSASPAMGFGAQGDAGDGQPTAEPVYQAPPASETPVPTYSPEPLPVSEADSYQYFYRPLQEHGEWVSIPGYGYCWQPRGVAPGWRPYCYGRWAWTDSGWTWVSDDPWGWACYHYGRWMPTSECGWVWVPGRQWAPAWVCWRRGPDFVGWAPLPPGAPMGAAIVGVAGGFHHGCWTMVYERDFLAPNCAVVAMPIHRVGLMLPRATIVVGVSQVNGVFVNIGFGRHSVERVIGHPVPIIRVSAVEVGHGHDRMHIEGGALVVIRPSREMRVTVIEPARVRHIERVTVISAPHLVHRDGPGHGPVEAHMVKPEVKPVSGFVERGRPGPSEALAPKPSPPPAKTRPAPVSSISTVPQKVKTSEVETPGKVGSAAMGSSSMSASGTPQKVKSADVALPSRPAAPSPTVQKARTSEIAQPSRPASPTISSSPTISQPRGKSVETSQPSSSGYTPAATPRSLPQTRSYREESTPAASTRSFTSSSSSSSTHTPQAQSGHSSNPTPQATSGSSAEPKKKSGKHPSSDQ